MAPLTTLMGFHDRYLAAASVGNPTPSSCLPKMLYASMSDIQLCERVHQTREVWVNHWFFLPMASDLVQRRRAMFSFLEGCGLALALLLPKLVLFVGNPIWLPLVDGFCPLNAIRQWGSSQSQVAWIEGLYKSVVLLWTIPFLWTKDNKSLQFHTSPFLPGISAPIVGLWVSYHMFNPSWTAQG